MFCPTAWHQHLFAFPSSFLSCLFPDVVNCMQTDNLELKKLVYLYLMNYAKSQPDMAIMAVNSFVKVTFSQGLKNSLFYLRKPFQKCLLIWLVSALQISNLCSKRGPLEKYWPLSRNIHDLSILYARVCHPVQMVRLLSAGLGASLPGGRRKPGETSLFYLPRLTKVGHIIVVSVTWGFTSFIFVEIMLMVQT